MVQAVAAPLTIPLSCAMESWWKCSPQAPMSRWEVDILLALIAPTLRTVLSGVLRRYCHHCLIPDVAVGVQPLREL